jgi:hypothetical protein
LRRENSLPLLGTELRPSVLKPFTSLTVIPRLIMAVDDEFKRIATMLVKAVVDEVKFHLVRYLICTVFGVRTNRKAIDSITKNNTLVDTEEISLLVRLGHFNITFFLSHRKIYRVLLTVAVWSRAHTLLDGSAMIATSNPSQGMDIYACSAALCYPV